MSASLVGSEMCIRDRPSPPPTDPPKWCPGAPEAHFRRVWGTFAPKRIEALLRICRCARGAVRD
eukprot:7391458-Alexandrium_andersonii.AAC.1